MRNKRFGPLLRARLWIYGRNHGASSDDLDYVIDKLRRPGGDDILEQAEAMAGVTVPTWADGQPITAPGGAPQAFGDGTIIKQILEWLSSPEGMAFIKAILAIFGLVV